MVKEIEMERRGSVRAKRILSIRHRLYKRQGKVCAEPWYLSTTENMSANGVLFVSAAKYETGDIVDIHIVMSGILDIFRGYGEVVRVQRKDRAAFYHIAVKYTSLKVRPQTSSPKSSSPKRPSTVKSRKRS